ncbi:hypothetical protein C8J56DRAFT_1031511 [Mycena floridula]|nr:hypothetical protein C8J56DRAFT_1031511 [Mycena floridula]
MLGPRTTFLLGSSLSLLWILLSLIELDLPDLALGGSIARWRRLNKNQAPPGSAENTIEVDQRILNDVLLAWFFSLVIVDSAAQFSNWDMDLDLAARWRDGIGSMKPFLPPGFTRKTVRNKVFWLLAVCLFRLALGYAFGVSQPISWASGTPLTRTGADGRGSIGSWSLDDTRAYQIAEKYGPGIRRKE